METISNKDKAREYLLKEHLSPLNNILYQCDLKTEFQYHKDIEKAFIKGAEWKDEQHEQEKQKMIEKAYEFISKKFFISVSDQAVSKENYCLLTELISDLTKAMKGE